MKIEKVKILKETFETENEEIKNQILLKHLNTIIDFNLIKEGNVYRILWDNDSRVMSSHRKLRDQNILVILKKEVSELIKFNEKSSSFNFDALIDKKIDECLDLRI